jgi:6-pyruvoyl-tetrahydropterin synthase
MRSCIPIYHGGASRQDSHCHTIEVALYLKTENGRAERFSEIERFIDEYLSRYDGEYLDTMPEFSGDSRMENLAEVFFAGLRESLGCHGLELTRLELGETPLRLLIIGLEQEEETD